MASRFCIEILDLTWPDLEFIYTWEEAWPALRQAADIKVMHVLRDTDIGRYDWALQEIALNGTGTRRLAFSGLGPSLQSGVGKAFRVVFDDEPVYGGLFYPHGAAAIRFPVIHAYGSPIERLNILPQLGAIPGWQQSIRSAPAMAILDAKVEAWCRATFD